MNTPRLTAPLLVLGAAALFGCGASNDNGSAARGVSSVNDAGACTSLDVTLLRRIAAASSASGAGVTTSDDFVA